MAITPQVSASLAPRISRAVIAGGGLSTDRSCQHAPGVNQYDHHADHDEHRGTAVGAERPTRPIPYPLTPSPEFQAAIANGSRTTTGEPGPNYWQQWTDYQLQVKLIPETKRIEGRARIVHHNRAPTPLPGLAFHLHQNVHAEGAIRNSTVEVTGGVELSRITMAGVELAENVARLGLATEKVEALAREKALKGIWAHPLEWKYIVEAGLTEEAEISGYKAMVERKEKASKLKAK